MKKFLQNTLCIMRTRNILLHPWRNNPRTVNYIYHRFIAYIGYENWKYYSEDIVNAWESASLSFDKMYGLIKAWKMIGLPDVQSAEKNREEAEEKIKIKKANGDKEAEEQAEKEKVKAKQKKLEDEEFDKKVDNLNKKIQIAELENKLYETKNKQSTDSSADSKQNYTVIFLK